MTRVQQLIETIKEFRKENEKLKEKLNQLKYPCDLCKHAGTVDDTICKGCPAERI